MKRPNSQPSILNSQLGGYEVRELLGTGGMASVYKGYDPQLDREVAIKVISTTGQPADFVARFQREARVVARLRHPHIVHVYHFGVQNDIVYMVQELLPGPTLEQRIREAGRRRIGAERVQTIIAELAGALDFAHSQGVIHRDVKPSNALYNAHGQLVLTDFGIARTSADNARTATGPGYVMGTPGYVAPEQAISSAALTPACDIYALGVVLFELLAGQLPFEADTPMGVVLKHLYDEPPPPSSLRPDLPKALDTVVLRALRKEPEERYPSAGALAEALRAAWPAGRSPASATAPRPRSTPKGNPASPPAPAPAPARQTPPPPAPARQTPPPIRQTPTPTPKARAVGAPAPKRDAPTPRSTPKPAAPASSAAAVKSTPARAPAARPKAAEKSAPVPAQPAPPSRRGQWRVGLFTVDIVGLLILAARPELLTTAWQTLRALIP